MITEVRINGTVYPLTGIEYEVTIQTGSAARWESPQSTTCQLAIWSQDSVPVQIGDELTIMDDDIGPGKARFRGQVTNVELVHPDPGIVRVQMIAQGPLMRLGRMTVGYSTLPEQTAHQRLEDLFTMAGVVAVTKDPGVSTVLVERALDNQKGSFMFEETMRSEPFDVWEMNIPLELRSGITFDKAEFDDNDPAAETTAVFLDQGTPSDWAIELFGELDRNRVNLYQVPSDAVVWEPRWRQDSGRVVNQFQITYGAYPPQGSSTPRPNIYIDSDASIATFGPSSTQITTDIKEATYAGVMGVKLLDSYAVPQWEVASCEVLLDAMSDVQRREAMTLIRPGLAIHINDLAAPAPATNSDFWVEGFTEVYKPGLHSMTLALTAIPTGPRFDYLEFDNADPASPATAVFNY